MRKFLIAAAATTIMCGSALAQDMSDGMSRSGMSSPMNANGKMMRHHRMKHHTMKKKMMKSDMNGGMGNGMMNNGMKNNGMKNDGKM